MLWPLPLLSELKLRLLRAFTSELVLLYSFRRIVTVAWSPNLPRYGTPDNCSIRQCIWCGHKVSRKVFWQYFPNDWKFSKWNFTRLWYVCKVTRFYSIIFNFDKVMLYEVRSSTGVLHFTWKTRKSAMSLQQHDRSPQNLTRWCRTRVSSAPPIKNFILKIKYGGRPISLRDPFRIIIRYCNLSIFKMAAVRHLGILKLELLTANNFRALHYLIKFRRDRSNCCRDIAFFVFFQWNAKTH